MHQQLTQTQPWGRKTGVALLCAVVTLSLVAACGGGDEGGEDGAAKVAIKRSMQQPVTEAAWQAVVADDDALGKLATATGRPFQAAGVIEGGDGRRLHWAEYAESADAPRDKVAVVFRRCDAKAACVVGTGVYTATGVALTDAAGVAVDALLLGEVVLHKTLKNHNLARNETVLRLDLKRNHIVDRALADTLVAAVTHGKRRLVLISAYGAAVGVPLKALRAVAQDSEIFDYVTVIEFARRRDLLALLPTMTPQDVLVWFGAGVLEPFTDKPAKSVGMTLSRGIFGDELIHRTHVDKLLDAPIMGGPGLILLVGSNSLTVDHAQQTGLMAEHLHQATYRPVVGFDGKLTAATAEAAAVATLKSLFAGDHLSDAMTAGSKAAQATATKATMTTMLTTDQAEAWRLPVAKGKFWSTPPKSATLRLYLKNSPKCVVLPTGGACTEAGFKVASQQGGDVPPEQLTAASVVFDCDPVFDGPWLSCTAKNAATGTDFTLRGVMTGQQEGDFILLTAAGAPSLKMKGVTIIGAGVIEKRSDAGGTLTMNFGGEAAGSTWTDAADHCCIAVTPLLTGNQSQRSVMTVKR